MSTIDEPEEPPEGDGEPPEGDGDETEPAPRTASDQRERIIELLEELTS